MYVRGAGERRTLVAAPAGCGEMEKCKCLCAYPKNVHHPWPLALKWARFHLAVAIVIVHQNVRPLHIIIVPNMGVHVGYADPPHITLVLANHKSITATPP